MSDPTTSHVPDEHGGSHIVAGPHGDVTDHGETHGHDDHAHAGAGLGPIAWPMWGAGVLGLIMGILVTYGLVLASGFSFSA